MTAAEDRAALLDAIGVVDFAEMIRTAIPWIIEGTATSEQACDGCHVQPDGTHDDGATCPCSTREPVGGCRDGARWCF